ncbi:MAG: hypothetical protein OEZ01_04575 [Candidatus Heimdallarchaeota archaeon]|nr:hypothetical protein [Candidatus Heimdallarchaeota archaeon]MDH5645255.1 hypothetical protein [Candidatus Heimdallarchaeota archaeon]
MSKSDEGFVSEGLYREESLYYDLGYRFATNDGKEVVRAFDRDYVLYLLGTSIFLMMMGGIIQIYTISIIVIHLFYSRYSNQSAKNTVKIPVLLLIILANVLDHQLSKVTLQPGELFQNKLTPTVWVIEIIWVIIFSLQALTTLQPTTPPIGPEPAVQPATSETLFNYETLSERLQKSNFDLNLNEKNINIEQLRQIFKQLVNYIFGVTFVAIIINLILWRILGSYGGGRNLAEEYLISGMVLILFVILMVFSNYIFPDEDIVDTHIETEMEF